MLRKELWTFAGDRIAVRFQYEWHDADGQWWRSYGNENWEFDADGLMRRREASINDVPIARVRAADPRAAAPEGDSAASRCAERGGQTSPPGQPGDDPQPCRVGGAVGPLAQPAARLHAELAGLDVRAQRRARLGRAVERRQQVVLDREREVETDQVGVLHRAEHGHARAEACS